MDEPIQRVEKALGLYTQADRDSYLHAARSLLGAVSGCLKYVRKNAQSDKGCAQRVARRLDELLEPVPGIGGVALGKEIVHRLHTRRLAEEQLELIEQHLQRMVKVAEEDKAKVIEGWMDSHPVFGELKTLMKQGLPQNSYILLFQRMEDGALKLVTESAKDGRIFTRFRPVEFAHALKIHKNYANELPVSGAVIIKDKEIVSIIGTVPEPQGNKDQLRTLLSISNAAAGKPAAQFMELNSVLKELHEMARRHKLSRDMYVLLFQSDTPLEPQITGDADFDTGALDEGAPDQEEMADDKDRDIESPDGDIDESVRAAESNIDQIVAEGEGHIDESIAPPDTDIGGTQAPIGASEDHNENMDAPPDAGDSESLSEAGESIESESEAGIESVIVDEPEDESESSSEDSPEDSMEDHADTLAEDTRSTDDSDLEIVTRTGEDGKILSRFWAPDFMIRHRLFDHFKTKTPIVGAAVIEKKKIHGRGVPPVLIKTIGRVPKSVAGKDQLGVLLNVSSSAIQKPFAEFVENHEVLRNLHELAKSEISAKDPDVIVFVQGAQGRLEVMPFSEGSGRPRSRTSLINFASMKDIYDKFQGQAEIVGASVITKSRRDGERPDRSDRSSFKKGRPDGGKKREAPDPRRSVETQEKPVVMAAFGRTPLKANLIATPEILSRMGITF